MSLLEECLEALKSYTVLGDNEKKNVENEFYSQVELTSWGRINWDKIEIKTLIDFDDLTNVCENVDFYIIWSDTQLPIVKCKFENILQNLDDVTAVSFDTWLLSVDKKTIIEFYHESEITVGQLKQS